MRVFSLSMGITLILNYVNLYDRDMEEYHKDIVKKEFSKQVKTLSHATFFTDQDIIEKIKYAAKLTACAKVLDVGCGPGIVTEALSPYVQTIVAYDLSPQMVEAARIRCTSAGLYNVEYETGMIESLPYEDEHFDRVVSRLVMHHLPETNKAFNEMYRVLKKGGKLILADIISDEERQKEMLHNTLEVLRDPSHIKMLALSELKEGLESSGFDIVFEDSWVKEREFSEWIAITNSPERAEPLKTVMNVLARSGFDAGINLRADANTVYFEHKWVLISASKKGNSNAC
jgi:ubiquinone/menaquinone biosynthesis C-methylase UbiE